jgi:acetyl esterase/lipase
LVACSVMALALSTMPLLQLPTTTQQMTKVMQAELGDSYLQKTVPKFGRSQPFNLIEAFRGISLQPIRYTSGIVFASPDNVPLTMDIYQPQQSKVYPAVVVIYGGAWQRGSASDNAAWNRYLANQGYVVFAIAYRHAPTHRFPTQLEDVQTALAFINDHATKYEADRDRIAIMGRSAGAQLAMLAAYQKPNSANPLPIRAVVNYYGPVNLTNGYNNPPKPDPLNVRSVLEDFLGGTPQTLPDLYRAASPSNYVAPNLPPTLLIYGKRDHIIESRYGKALFDRLKSAQNTAVFLEIPWAEHAFDAVFRGPSNQLALYYTERFLDWALRSIPK